MTKTTRTRKFAFFVCSDELRPSTREQRDATDSPPSQTVDGFGHPTQNPRPPFQHCR